ncbi:hypothetical protein THAOC_25286, partial [Thalassiosira oceanica]
MPPTAQMSPLLYWPRKKKNDSARRFRFARCSGRGVAEFNDGDMEWKVKRRDGRRARPTLPRTRARAPDDTAWNPNASSGLMASARAEEPIGARRRDATATASASGQYRHTIQQGNIGTLAYSPKGRRMPSNAGEDEQADGAAEVRLTETDVQEILNPGEVPGLPPLEAANIEGAADSQDSQDHQDTPLAEAAGTMASLADDDNAGAMDEDDDDRKPPALPAAASVPGGAHR